MRATRRRTARPPKNEEVSTELGSVLASASGVHGWLMGFFPFRVITSLVRLRRMELVRSRAGHNYSAAVRQRSSQPHAARERVLIACCCGVGGCRRHVRCSCSRARGTHQRSNASPSCLWPCARGGWEGGVSWGSVMSRERKPSACLCGVVFCMLQVSMQLQTDQSSSLCFPLMWSLILIRSPSGHLTVKPFRRLVLYYCS